jgi:deoxyhypusine synthase
MISSGLRETFRYLVQHRHVSAIVTTAGGVEEDFIKCLAPTYLGSFSASGAALRAKGLNRIGNLVVPNNNYCAFEDWVVPILDKMLVEQEEEFAKSGQRFMWTPSKIINRLGKEINNESSVYYWAYKNDIPVFCPALTDGSLGDMIYFHSFKASPLQLGIDIAQDIRKINTIAVRAKRAGMIILGGGVVKHHIANACLMRNGAESAVYVNTAQEFDGSDAGARPDEAVSWGKYVTQKSLHFCRSLNLLRVSLSADHDLGSNLVATASRYGQYTCDGCTHTNLKMHRCMSRLQLLSLSSSLEHLQSQTEARTKTQTRRPLPLQPFKKESSWFHP